MHEPTSASLEELRAYVAGEWTSARSGETFETLDPYTGIPWALVPECGEDDVDRAVGAARAAFQEGPWPAMSGRDRRNLLRRLGDILERDAEELAQIETRDNGKLLKEMRTQTGYLPEWFHYFSGAAERIEGSVIPTERSNFLTYTLREPLGVVAAICPWNSPLVLMATKVAPALAAGCTVVVKPSEFTPASTLRFARCVEEAGFPPGVFNVVTGHGVTGAALSAHPEVDKVAFTGSTATGVRIAQSAAEHVARTLLELGGKSPNIVFPDADLEAAANGIVAGIFAATGQTCMAGSRVLVHESIHDEVVARVAERARTIRLGDPRDPGTEMGPAANAAQLAKVLAAIEGAVRAGATVAAGGGQPDLGGLFVEPTVLTGVTNDMQVAQEEIFGPVASVIPFNTEDEAISIGNHTRFGLAAGIWTKDVHRAHRVAARLRAGTVWVNAYRVVGYNTPFGGFKESGIGRENGMEGLDGFLETKTVWVELTGATRDPFTIG